MTNILYEDADFVPVDILKYSDDDGKNKTYYMHKFEEEVGYDLRKMINSLRAKRDELEHLTQSRQMLKTSSRYNGYFYE